MSNSYKYISIENVLNVERMMVSQVCDLETEDAASVIAWLMKYTDAICAEAEKE